MSPVERALARAHSAANRLAGVTIVYRRDGVGQVELIATLAQTTVERSDSEGAIVRTHVRDYLLTVAELKFDGRQFVPETGDKIYEQVGIQTFVMEVRPPLGEGNPWRWHGLAHDAVRVHTKQVATEET